MNSGPWKVKWGNWYVIMRPCNVNRVSWNEFMGEYNVIMGPLNVERGPVM